MTEQQKAQAYDDIMWWIDVSVWRDTKESANEALDSILKYTLGMYWATQMKPEDIIDDRATETPDWEYESLTRWLLCPIEDNAWYFWYKAGKDILSNKSE